MNDCERQQSKLISDHALTPFRGVIGARINMVFADHSANGRLHSGATVKASVRGMDELLNVFLTDLKNRISDVATDPEAFGVLSKGVEQALEACAAQMLSVTKMASGRLQGPVDRGVATAAQQLFDDMRSDVEAKLAIARFDFDDPPPAPIAEVPFALATAMPPVRKGGRPPAEFWDSMWAAIAASLYNGELKPRSQADVERAMATWIEANNFSAADSTVRGRARRLWDRIASLDE